MEPQSAILVVVIPAHAPGVNHYVQHTRDGRHYITSEAQQWIGLAKLLTTRCRMAYRWQDPGGEFELLIEHNNTRQDVDGCQKVVMDAVTAALGVNDHRIRSVTTRRAAFEQPTVRVELKAVA